MSYDVDGILRRGMRHILQTPPLRNSETQEVAPGRISGRVSKENLRSRLQPWFLGEIHGKTTII